MLHNNILQKHIYTEKMSGSILFLSESSFVKKFMHGTELKSWDDRYMLCSFTFITE